MNKPRKILIVRTDRMGDVILSTPVIKNLRIAYPESHIAFMCRPYTKDIIEGNPYVDEVIVYDKYGKHKSFFSSVKFAQTIRKKQFDWAIILHPTMRVHVISFLAGIRVRVGWNRKGGFLLTKRLVHTKQEGIKHELEYTLDVIAAMGVPVEDREIYFPIKERDAQYVDALLKDKGIEEEQSFIVIHPSASCVSKRWPQEYFSRLMFLLKEETQYPFLIVSSFEERAFADMLVREQSDSIDLRGALTLGQLGALLKRARLFISNDSGPVHIASAVKTPVISLFGRKDKGLSPTRWRPWSNKAYALHAESGCLVCEAHNCAKEYLCLRNLTPERVFSIAKKLLHEVP